MAIVKIEEVYLYTSEHSGDVAENILAAAFMDRAGIPFTRLLYNDVTQSAEVLETLNTWWPKFDSSLPPLTAYPFIVYTEVHDDIPARSSPVKYVSGIEAIKAFPSFYTSINGNK